MRPSIGSESPVLARWRRERTFERQKALGANAGLVGMGSATTSPTGTSTSPLMAGLGTASTVAGLFGTLGKAGLFDWGSSKDPTMGGVV